MGSSLATMKQVAKTAGVSTATVSRVINGKNNVSIDSANKVRAAIAELNYVPDSTARSLRKKDARNIAVILPTFHNTFFGQMLEAIILSATDYDFNIKVYTSNSSKEKELENLKMAVTTDVSAMIISPVGHFTDEEIQEYIPTNIPVVIACKSNVVPGLPHVYDNTAQAAEEITKYLIRLNRRKIAFFASFWDENITRERMLELYKIERYRGAYSALDRLQGYIRALEDASIEFNPNLVFPCEFNYTSGCEVTRKLLASLQEFDAILCFNDDVAAGAIQILREQNIDVPNGVSVASSGDTQTAIITRPALTTVKTFPRILGSKAVEVCRDMLNSIPVSDVILNMELVVRTSTAAKI